MIRQVVGSSPTYPTLVQVSGLLDVNVKRCDPRHLSSV